MPRIEHVALFADHVDRLRRFYEEAFGLTVVVDNSRAPVRGYFLSDGQGAALELIERPGGAQAVDQRYVCHVAFQVDDFDAARATLAGLGVRFERDSQVESEAMRTAFFQDPEGNRCQIVWRSAPLGR